MLWLVGKGIADTGHGENILRDAGIWFDLAAQSTDQPAYEFLVPAPAVAPYALYNAFGG